MQSTGNNIAPLTALRGFAAAWVVLMHMGLRFPDYWFDSGAFTERGYLGVDIFFVLSGYIMMHVYGRNCIPVRFIALRLARLYPVHVTALAAHAAVAWSIGYVDAYPFRFTFDALIAQLTLTSAWGVLPMLGWNTPAWSISAEWFAYLCFPLTVLLWRRITPLLACGVALISWASLTSLFVLDPQNGLDQHVGGALIRIMAEFSIGMSLRVIAQAPIAQRAPWDALAIVAAATLWAIPTYGLHDLLVFPSIAALILAGHLAQGAFKRAMSFPLLVHLGHISYSVYLVHLMFLILFGAAAPYLPGPSLMWVAICLAATLVFADLMWRFVEEPSRKAARRWLDRVSPAPAPARIDAPGLSGPAAPAAAFQRRETFP